jgi:hypothetical protein
VCALTTFSWPLGPALAQGKPADVPRILLVGVEPTAKNVPPLLPRRVSERIAGDLAAQPELEVLGIVDDAGDSATAPPAPPATDRLDEGKTSMIAARGALDAENLARAEERALRAARAFEDSAEVLTDENLLIDAYLVLGVTRSLQGRDDEARGAFRQALAFGPTTLPDVGRYGKKVVKAFADAQAEFAKLPRTSLHVEVEPGEVNAFVWIDGANRGEAPVDLMDLSPGVHLLRIVAEGYRLHGERVLLAGAAARTTVVLESKVSSARAPDPVRAALRTELKKRAQAGVVDASAKPVFLRLAERTGATHLVVGMVGTQAQGFAIRLFLYRTEDKKLVELDAATFDAELLKLENATLAASRSLLRAIREFPVARDITATLSPHAVRTGDGEDSQLIGDGKHRDARDLGGQTSHRTWWIVGGTGVVILTAAVIILTVSGSGTVEGYDGRVVLP